MANLLRVVSLCLLILLVWLLSQVISSPTTAEPPAAPPSQAQDWRFGVVESYEDPAAATNLGVAWTRVRFHWAYVQAAGPDTWTPRVTEDQINGELAAGRTVVGILIGIPDWARDTNRLPPVSGCPMMIPAIPGPIMCARRSVV
jgi:Na+-transporting methylmalonyl-CoA/oxaloacetate decarboxylase gamma subunit